jgi:hypothetical protein
MSKTANQNGSWLLTADLSSGGLVLHLVNYCSIRVIIVVTFAAGFKNS